MLAGFFYMLYADSAFPKMTNFGFSIYGKLHYVLRHSFLRSRRLHAGFMHRSACPLPLTLLFSVSLAPISLLTWFALGAYTCGTFG
jgi:hypothetical protein